MLTLSIDRQESVAAGFVKSKGYSLPAGIVTLDVAKMLPKPKGLPAVVIVKVKGREGKVVLPKAGKCSAKTLKV